MGESIEKSETPECTKCGCFNFKETYCQDCYTESRKDLVKKIEAILNKGSVRDAFFGYCYPTFVLNRRYYVELKNLLYNERR